MFIAPASVFFGSELIVLKFLGYRGNLNYPADFFEITCQTNLLQFSFIEKVFINRLCEPKNQIVFNSWP